MSVRTQTALLSLSLFLLAALGTATAPKLRAAAHPPAVDPPVAPDCTPLPGWFEVDGSDPLHHYRRLVETFPDGVLDDHSPENFALEYRATVGKLEVVDAFVRQAGGRCEVLAVESLNREATVEELVHAVGLWREGELLLVYHLDKTPHRSVRALIAQLDPLWDGPQDGTQARQMARTVVALESITGRSFAFYPLELDAETDPCFSFGFPAGYFGYRMSWAMMCLAPPFERLRVFNAWRDWARAEGENFEPVPLGELDPSLVP